MSGLAVRLPGNKIRLPRLAFSGLTKNSCVEVFLPLVLYPLHSSQLRTDGYVERLFFIPLWLSAEPTAAICLSGLFDIFSI
jgi:hypothetical protein